jgi:hypothetical protein
MDQDPEKQSLSLAALTVADLAKLLTRVNGQPVPVSMIEADLAAGAPANADGTINLVHYAAWHAREVAGHE